MFSHILAGGHLADYEQQKLDFVLSNLSRH